MPSTGVAISVEVATSSHIVEMIKELVQLKGLEVPATGMISEGTNTTAGEASSQSNLPKNLPSLDSQLGRRIQILKKFIRGLIIIANINIMIAESTGLA